MNEQQYAPKLLSSPVRQIGLLVGVVVLGVLAKQIISATSRWRVFVERFSWLGWTATILGLCILAVVAAGVAAVFGKKLNRPTAVLLGIVAGGLATAIAYHPMFGGAIGLVVGGIVAAGFGRIGGLAALKMLAAIILGASVGTLAFSFLDSWHELPIITSAILSTVFVLTGVALFGPVLRRILTPPPPEVAGQNSSEQPPNLPSIAFQFIAPGVLLIVVVFGFWLGLCIDTVLRIRSVAGAGYLRGLSRTSIGVHWLWQGIMDVHWVALREDATDADVAKLQRFENLSSLSAYRCPHLTDQSLETIKKLPGIRQLHLNGVMITDDGLKHLRGMSALNGLSLSDTNVTGAGLIHVPPSLVVLDLVDMPISDDGLNNLSHLRLLRRLHLKHTQISDAGLDHLVGLSTLQGISLEGTKISDDGLQKLARLKSLKYVLLDDTGVTDEGLAHLCQLSGLDHLDLSNTRVTDVGLDHLKKITTLKFIGLKGTQVTDAGVKDLEKALPGVAIEAPGQRSTR